MNYGFIKTATAIPDCKVADCLYNSGQIIELLQEADRQEIEIIVFPELCITGYTCGDLFGQPLLLDEAEAALSRIVNATRQTKALAIVGCPLRQDNRLFNTAVVIGNGTIYGIVPKSFLPNYKEFYEKRWFCQADETDKGSITYCNMEVPFGPRLLFTSGKVSLAVELCEDLWVAIPPASYHSLHGANIIANLSASNDLVGKHNYLRQLITQQSARTVSAYLYASAGLGESSTDVVFGGNGIIAENGIILAESRRFSDSPQLTISEIDIERLMCERLGNTGFTDCIDKNSYRTIPIELPHYSITRLSRKIDPHPFIPHIEQLLNERCEEIFNIQVSGLVKRLKHINAKTAVVGISGGLDSTLALLVAVRAFDRLNLSRKQIQGITMPGFGTTDRTYNNALDLMYSLGVTIQEIGIEKACLQHFKDIGHDVSVHDVTYENSQARERTQILMDIANQSNGLVIGTGDLSELALGWATYNGDHMSMYGVNVSIPKTLVRHLVRYYADNCKDKELSDTLLDILDTPVSPELLPPQEDGTIAQKTEDLVGPYELHDFYLYHMLRFGVQPKKLFRIAKIAFDGEYAPEVIYKWLRTFVWRFFAQQFKRSCLPDGPKVGSVAVSPRGDLRMPSDAAVQLWIKQLDDIREEYHF